VQTFELSPLAPVKIACRQRQLIFAMIRREILGRYRGSVFGLLWALLNPLVMLTVYTFVFSVVFNARWGGGNSSRLEFALVLFAGLMIFNLFAECINRAPSAILANVNYVKKVVFPLEILPLINLGAALFHMFISFFVWLVFYGVFFGWPPLTSLWLPVIIFPLLMLVMGGSWLFSSLGVYIRDTAQIVAVATTMLMFLSPIFYPLSALPDAYQPLLLLNPLTPAIEMTRDSLIWGKAPDPIMLASYYGITALVCWIGFVFFQKTRKGFADVL
jgi:lipopolysaccharide transport system permease protein